MQLRREPLAHEVLLEGKLPPVGGEAGPHGLVRHRQHRGRDAEPAAELQRRLGQRAALAEELGPQDVRAEVRVADAKPDRLTGPRQRVEHMERVVLQPIARFLVEHAREPVDDRVDVGTHEQTPELIVVGGVRDHREIRGAEQRLHTRGQARTARPAGEDDALQRKRSSAAGRISSRPVPAPSSCRPRTITAGVRSVLPITTPAAEARSSEMASTVACSGRPASSRLPRRSIAAGRPATPSATLTMPTRQGRPKVSDTITPTSTPTRSRILKRRRTALASGSTGSRLSMSVPPTLE